MLHVTINVLPKGKFIKLKCIAERKVYQTYRKIVEKYVLTFIIFMLSIEPTFFVNMVSYHILQVKYLNFFKMNGVLTYII